MAYVTHTNTLFKIRNKINGNFYQSLKCYGHCWVIEGGNIWEEEEDVNVSKACIERNADDVNVGDLEVISFKLIKE